MRRKILFTLLLFGGILAAKAQEQKPEPAPASQPLIPIEFLPGSDRFYFQSIISRDIPLTDGKLRFISVTNYATEYKNENASENDFVSVNILSYKITKYIGAGPSAANVAGLGWIPSLGFQFGVRKSNWAIIFNPAISLSKETNSNNVLVAEYFPRLTTGKNWKLYTRFQALYIHNLENGDHMRSSYFGRLGVSYKQYTLGFAANYDYYGRSKREKDNYGPFLRIQL